MSKWFLVYVGLRQGCVMSPWLSEMAFSTQKENLCRLVFGRVCERRKLRVNVGKSKVIRCSSYGNLGRMHVILNGERLEQLDFLKCLGSQVAADGGFERNVVHNMNEGYRAWEALKSVLSNRGQGIKAKK